MLRHVANDARPDAVRIPNHQRHPQGWIVAAVLLEPAVLSEIVAVIGRVDHKSVGVEIEFTELM